MTVALTAAAAANEAKALADASPMPDSSDKSSDVSSHGDGKVHLNLPKASLNSTSADLRASGEDGLIAALKAAAAANEAKAKADASPMPDSSDDDYGNDDGGDAIAPKLPPTPASTGFKLNMSAVHRDAVDDSKPLAQPHTPRESIVAQCTTPAPPDLSASAGMA